MGYSLLEIATAYLGVLEGLRDLYQMIRIRDRAAMISEWDIKLALPVYTIQAIPADAIQVYELGSTMGNIRERGFPDSIVGLLFIGPLPKGGNEVAGFIA